MSPEQCRGEVLDPRSDLYSLGATYFTLLTGSSPYPCETPVEVMLAHCTSPVPDPGRRVPTLPAGCSTIIKQAMAKEPADRFATAVHMLAALEALLPPPPRVLPVQSKVSRWTRSMWLGLLLLALVVTVVGAVAVGYSVRERDVPLRADNVENVHSPQVSLAEGTLDAGGEVEALAFTREDRHLVWVTSGTNTNFVRQRDLQSGKHSSATLPHRGFCLAVTPDGRSVIVGTSDSRVRVFDTTKELAERPGFDSPGGSVHSLAISSDGTWLVAGLEPWGEGTTTLRVIRLWDRETGKPIGRPLADHEGGVLRGLAFSHDGQFLVSGASDRKLRVRHTSGVQANGR